jgi:hypothetical protein
MRETEPIYIPSKSIRSDRKRKSTFSQLPFANQQENKKEIRSSHPNSSGI